MPRPPRLAPLACLLAAACGNSGPPAGTTGGAVTSEPRPTAATTAPSVTDTPTAAPGMSASAIPTAQPTTAPTTAAAAPADAGAPHDAGAKPPRVASSATASADAGATDAGAVAASDAGAAQGSPALAIARQIDAIFAAKKTFSAKFKQQFTLKVTGATKDSTGVVLVERPNKISFRYDPPSKQRIVSDGSTIKVYMGDEGQMTEMPVAKTEYPGALAFMMGSGIAKSFDFTINTRAKWDGGVVLDGKPLTASPTNELTMFFIDKALLDRSDPGAMKSLLIVDAQGNRNRFTFESVTQPDRIDPAEFSFTPPPGTNILRQGM